MLFDGADWRTSLTFVAAALLVAAGLAMIVRAPRLIRHATFGAFLVISGGVALMSAQVQLALAQQPLDLALVGRSVGTREVFTVAADLAALLFVLHFPRARGLLAGRPRLSQALVASAVLLVFATLLVPGLYIQTAIAGDGSPVRTGPPGPLSLLVTIPTFWIYAVVLTRDHLLAPAGPLRRATLLVALGFLLHRGAVAGFEAASFLADPRAALAFSPYGDGFFGSLGVLRGPLALLLLGWLMVLLLRASLAGPARRPPSARPLLVLVLVLVSLGVARAAFGWTGALQLQTLLDVSLPLLVIYGLLSGEILGLDRALRVGVQRSTVVAVFLGSALVVAEVVRDYASDEWGYLAGGIVAAMLLGAAKPIQRFGERVAALAVPEGVYAPLDQAARERVYRDLVQQAWADGAIDKGERLMLEKLRLSLGLSSDDCLRIEVETAV